MTPCVPESSVRTQGLQPARGLWRESLHWDAGKMHSAPRACLERHQQKPCAGPGALRGRRSPHRPAHSRPKPAHTPVTALSRPSAPHFSAGTESSGPRPLPAREAGARGAPTARAPSGCKPPAPLPPRPDLVRPGRRLASSAAPASGGLFKSYLWRSGGGPGCGAGDGGADREASRAPPGGPSRPAGE